MGPDLGIDPQIMQKAVLLINGNDKTVSYIDCFSTKEVQQTWTTAFIARFPHPDSMATDALDQNWQLPIFARAQLYCFPPERIVGRTLQMFKDQKTAAVIVVPYYQKRPQWWELFTNYPK